MKPATIVLLIAMALPTGTPVTSGDSNHTTRDGGWWMKLSEAQKLGYVQGWGDGESRVISRECSNKKPLPDGKQLDSCVKEKENFLAVPRDYTMGQFVDGIDHLYADYRNRLIPVSFIAEEVEKQIIGRPDAEIEADFEELRQAVQRLRK